MQAGYNAYSYNAYPGQYYAPQTAFSNSYSNGGGQPSGNIYADWPKMGQPQAGGQSAMPRPRQGRDPRQSNGLGNTPMPRPTQLSTRYNPQLKSAMKRPSRSGSDPSGQLQRARTNSDPRRTLNPMTRTRTNSNAAKDIPGSFHLQFISNLLRLWPRSLVCVITRHRSPTDPEC